MNIFATSKNPCVSANFLDTKRQIKMILESAQIMSSALRLNGCEDIRLYKLTHSKHPCVKWAGASRSNFKWLLKHFKCLHAIYKYKYRRTHKSYERLKGIEELIHFIPEGKLTEFAKCVRAQKYHLDFNYVQDTNKAYRMYLKAKWRLNENVTRHRQKQGSNSYR